MVCLCYSPSILLLHIPRQDLQTTTLCLPIVSFQTTSTLKSGLGDRKSRTNQMHRVQLQHAQENGFPKKCMFLTWIKSRMYKPLLAVWLTLSTIKIYNRFFFLILAPAHSHAQLDSEQPRKIVIFECTSSPSHHHCWGQWWQWIGLLVPPPHLFSGAGTKESSLLFPSPHYCNVKLHFLISGRVTLLPSPTLLFQEHAQKQITNQYV